MFINKDSILITANGHALNVGRYITEAKFGYHKLWAEDSGRNLQGTMIATLNGIYPKITLEFRQLTKHELEQLVQILDSARQTVSYYDPFKKHQITMETYTGDYEVSNKNIIDEVMKNEGFSCSFISTEKRR